jgi:hypothetical protein
MTLNLLFLLKNVPPNTRRVGTTGCSVVVTTMP